MDIDDVAANAGVTPSANTPAATRPVATLMRVALLLNNEAPSEKMIS
jgi:hypothetical protein